MLATKSKVSNRLMPKPGVHEARKNPSDMLKATRVPIPKINTPMEMTARGRDQFQRSMR